MTPRPPGFGSTLLSGLLIFVVVAGAATAIIRYVEGRTQLVRDLDAAVKRTNAHLSQGSAERAAKTLDVAAVAIVRGGEVDQFNIARGRRITARAGSRTTLHEHALFGKATLIARAGRLEAELERGSQPMGRELSRITELAGVTYFLIDVPLWRSGSSPKPAGFARVLQRAPPLTPAIDMIRFGLSALAGLLLLGLAMMWRRRVSRLVVGLALGGAAAILGGGQSLTTCLALLGTVSLAGAGLVPGFSNVLRDMVKQPRTYLLIAPAFIAMLLVVFLPFVMGVVLAFVDRDGLFVGLDHFREILVPAESEHPNFYWTFGVTLLWTVTNIILHVGIGVALALVLNRPSLRFRGLYRVLLIVPWAVPSYVTALVWKGMFNTNEGAINALLALTGMEGVDWLGQSFATNFIANLATNAWLGFPFMMVVTLGALQSIPRDLYEAADIDGASRWQRFRYVTAPLLKPALVPAIILGTIWTFNMFNVIYLVSNGAPDNETNILITEAYRAFRADRFGYAAAYSLIIFGILLIYGWMTGRVTRLSEGAYS